MPGLGLEGGFRKGQLNAIYGSMGTGKSMHNSNNKDISWVSEPIIKNFKRWEGYVSLISARTDELIEMYDWLVETFNNKNFHFYVYDYRSHETREIFWASGNYEETLDAIRKRHGNLAKILFKNREDAAIFMLTFAGET